MQAKNPSQSYNKAIGTLQTYGASVHELPQYASSQYASNDKARSSFLSSVTSSADKSNTVSKFNLQGSAVGNGNPVEPNAAARAVPVVGSMVLFTSVVGVLVMGVVFL